MNLWGLYLLRPWWLLGILPCALLLLLAKRHYLQANEWNNVLDVHLRPHLLQREGNIQIPLILAGLAWLLSIIALVGPAWEKVPHPLQQSKSALIMALDLSPSMYAQDIKPSRLERARNKLNDALDRRDEGLTGLIVYGADAFSITPLTDDTDTIRNLLNAVSPDTLPRNAWGSNPASAMAEAESMMLGGGVQTARVLMVTDGINSRDKKKIAAYLKTNNIRLSVLGIGTSNGAPIRKPNGDFIRDSKGDAIIATFNPATLRDLVREYGGRYRSLTLDDSDISHLLPENYQDGNTRETERQSDLWREQGQWLLLLILPLALMSFRRGWLLCVYLLLGGIASAPSAQALQWEDLWQRPDQQAGELIKSEEYVGAAELFEDTNWRAFAKYRNGNYAKALEDWPEENGDARTYYNRGNALAQMRRIPEAISAYDAAIDLDPDFEDAYHNRSLLESIQSQQQDGQQQQPNPQQGDSQQGDSQQGDSQQSNQQQSAGEQGSEQGDSQQSNQQQSAGEQGSEQGDAQQSSSDNKDAGKNDGQQEQENNQYLRDLAERVANEQQQNQTNANDRTDEKNNEARDAGQEEQSPSEESTNPTQSNKRNRSKESSQTTDLATLLRQEGSADAETEREQTARTLLLQIPDNPSELLKKKLYYQQIQRERENRSRVSKNNPGL